jgi:hypothetical protein
LQEGEGKFLSVESLRGEGRFNLFNLNGVHSPAYSASSYRGYRA